MNSGDVSEPIISVDKILFLKLNEVRKISNRNDLDLNKLKKTIVQKKENEMLNLYASSHLSKKEMEQILNF